MSYNSAYTMGLDPSQMIQDRQDYMRYVTDLINIMEGKNVATATVEKPNTGDKVELVVKGTYGKNAYGDHWITPEDGTTKLYVNNDSLRNRLKVTQKSIPEPSIYGTIVSTGKYGDKYVKTSVGWRYIGVGSTLSTTVYTWAKLQELAKGLGLFAHVARPLDAKVNDIWDDRTKFTTASGATNDYYVRASDNALVNASMSTTLTRDESIRLARAILASNGLEA